MLEDKIREQICNLFPVINLYQHWDLCLEELWVHSQHRNHCMRPSERHLGDLGLGRLCCSI